MRRQTPQSRSCTTPSHGSPSAASPSNACCQTTAAATRSFAWRDACTSLGVTHKRTRPYRPQTNGKIERFHRTLADGWAYARRYDSETARRDALQPWLHFYNHHRAHSAIGAPTASQPPDQPAWTSQLADGERRPAPAEARPVTLPAGLTAGVSDLRPERHRPATQPRTRRWEVRGEPGRVRLRCTD